MLRFSTFEECRAVLMPEKLVHKNQACFWNKRCRKAEKEAAEDVKAAGRVRIFDSTDGPTKDLDEK